MSAFEQLCVFLLLASSACSGAEPRVCFLARRAAAAASRAQAALEHAAGDAVEDAVHRAEVALAEAEAAEGRAAAAAAVSTAHEEVAGTQAGAAEQVGCNILLASWAMQKEHKVALSWLHCWGAWQVGRCTGARLHVPPVHSCSFANALLAAEGTFTLPYVLTRMQARSLFY